jgi:predicted glycosyltransferase
MPHLGRPASGQPLRIALYSHDTMGLGHMRRNLLIAQTLASADRNITILQIVGAREAGTFTPPPGVDFLILPALHKLPDGGYRARSLDISLETLAALRGSAIRGALEAFAPDILLVDNVPQGAVKELLPALSWLRHHRTTRCVLGPRDVLDDPEVVAHEWKCAGNEEAIREFYDAVWIYGDRAVYDMVREYAFRSDVAARMRYTGYLNQTERLRYSQADSAQMVAELNLPPGRLALCLVGGGQDGAELASAFARAEMPAGTNAVLVTGPFMPAVARRDLQRCADENPCLRVLEFGFVGQGYLLEDDARAFIVRQRLGKQVQRPVDIRPVRRAFGRLQRRPTRQRRERCVGAV